MCTDRLLFTIVVFLWSLLIVVKIFCTNECSYKGFSESRVVENPYMLDSLNTTRVVSPSRFEFQPCSNNGFAENGICKSCPLDMKYNQNGGLCYKKTIDIHKTFDKICPRDTIPFKDKCIYPCPVGFVENETTTSCDPLKNTGITPYLSPIHCPLETPYLNKTTMKCQKNPPVLLNTTTVFQPSSAESSVII